MGGLLVELEARLMNIVGLCISPAEVVRPALWLWHYSHVLRWSSYIPLILSYTYDAGVLLAYFIKASWAHAGTFGGCGLYLITFILCLVLEANL